MDRPTTELIERFCAAHAFPTGPVITPNYVADNRGHLAKQFPEWRCFRDITFFFKYFQNPDEEMFPDQGSFTQRELETTFEWQPNRKSFAIKICDGNYSCLCRPRPRRKGEVTPTFRFPSRALAGSYTHPHAVEGEDDILHLWDLPDFGSLADGSRSKALGQQDSELLLSFLTVPYMRIPLVTSFFAHDDRVHALQSRQLQGVLDAVLFEPGNFLPAAQAHLEPVDCPTSAPAVLGTAHHLLLSELRHSPRMFLEALERLLAQAIDLDTGSITASTSSVILYVALSLIHI